MNVEQLPFDHVLERLFSDEVVPVSLIYRLSDMNPDEFDLFQGQWPNVPSSRRRVIARHMADLSEENFVVDFSPAFCLLLEDDCDEVRLAALDGLWDTSNTSAVTPIIRLMLSDRETSVQASAAATLGHFVLMGEWGQISQNVVAPIIQVLLEQMDQHDLPESVRRATLESLGASSHPRVPHLIDEAYRSGNESMQLSAVFAMGRSADRRWVPVILEEMYNPHAEMRIEAARAAGGVGHSDSVDRLIELLDDDELEVQLASVNSLGQIGSDHAFEALQRLMDDPGAYRLLEAVEEAMEEMQWMGGEIDLTMFDWENDDLMA